MQGEIFRQLQGNSCATLDKALSMDCFKSMIMERKKISRCMDKKKLLSSFYQK
jgi:hypothetical protein